MRLLRPSWIFPLVILFAGIVASMGLADHERRTLAEERQQAARLVADHLRAVAGEAESELNRAGTRIDQTVQIAAAAVADAADRQETVGGDQHRYLAARIEALGPVGSGQVIEAVIASHDDLVVSDPPPGRAARPTLPEAEEGFSQIRVGSWSGYLAYRRDASTPSRAGVAIIDREVLIERVESSELDGITITLLGLPGDDRLITDTGDWESVGRGLVIGPAGQAVLTRQATLLGRSVVLEIEAEPSVVWRPERETGTFTMVIGGLLSALVAGAVALLVRRLGQARVERDVAIAGRQAAVARFGSSFEHAPIGVVELDPDGVILAVNPRFAGQLGYVPEELHGVELLDLLDGEDRPDATVRLKEILDGHVDNAQAERRYRSRNGGAVWVRESISIVGTEDGTRHLLVQAEDISEERRARADLHRKALFDSLTGLPNRANLIAKLNRALDADRPANDRLAVLFVDLNKFKQVNDTFGHDAGDQLLIEVAGRLRRVCRSTDTVARLGGDEFVVLCEGLPSEEAAEEAVTRFVEALHDPVVYRGNPLPVSASIGLVVNAEKASADDILRQADEAMYQAKMSESVQLVRFDRAVAPTVEDDQEGERPITEPELRQAVDDESFRLFYQPIRSSASTEVVGVEALVRWEHPDLGLLSAGEFLPVAEEHGLLTRIDAWALREGVAALARWSELDEGCAEWFMTFNVAPANFSDRGFADEVSALLEANGVTPERIVFERNETWFVNQTPVAVLTTRDLRALGVQVALDHFGTGQATFSELSAVEFDVLKIDRSFVRDARRHSTYVLEAMRSMGEALDLKVIVEGIETAEELAIVERSGVPFAQGYHLGRPVDEDTLLLGVGVTGEPGDDDSVDGDVDLAGAAAEHGDD